MSNPASESTATVTAPSKHGEPTGRRRRPAQRPRCLSRPRGHDGLVRRLEGAALLAAFGPREVQRSGGLALRAFATAVVAGGGGHRGMPGELLHRGDVGAEVEQVADPRTPAVVRGEASTQPSLAGTQLEALEHRLGAHRAQRELAALVDRAEQRARAEAPDGVADRTRNGPGVVVGHSKFSTPFSDTGSGLPPPVGSVVDHAEERFLSRRNALIDSLICIGPSAGARQGTQGATHGTLRRTHRRCPT